MIDRQQKRFLASLAAILAKMAKDDGCVTADEVAAVGGIWHRLGLDSEKVAYCSMAFQAAQEDSIAFEDYVREYIATKYGKDTRAFLYELLWEVSCADGILHHNESSRLRKLPSVLGLATGVYAHYYAQFITVGKLAVDEIVEEKRKAREAAAAEAAERERKRKAKEAAAARERLHRERERQRMEDEKRRKEEARRREEEIARMSPLERAYITLGCNDTDSDAVLKKAYRISAQKWHPDHLRADGVSEDLIQKANAKMAAINAAWDLIKKNRNL